MIRVKFLVTAKNCNKQHHSDIQSSHKSAVYYNCVNKKKYFCNGTVHEPNYGIQNLSKSQKKHLQTKQNPKLKHSI